MLAVTAIYAIHKLLPATLLAGGNISDGDSQ
jgi:hypothetical protein